MKRLFTVMRQCYSGIDEDVCWDKEYDYFTSKSEANKFALELERSYADVGWIGHPWHRSKFYVWEINKEYLEAKQNTYANMMAAYA